MKKLVIMDLWRLQILDVIVVDGGTMETIYDILQEGTGNKRGIFLLVF